MRTFNLTSKPMMWLYYGIAAELMPKPPFFDGYVPSAALFVPSGSEASGWTGRFRRTMAESVPGGANSVAWLQRHAASGGEALLPSGVAVKSYEQPGGLMFWLGEAVA